MNSVLNYKGETFLDSDFEITIDVSLDSNNGVFRRYHVGNNPVMRIDPSGLCVDAVSFGKITTPNAGFTDIVNKIMNTNLTTGQAEALLKTTSGLGLISVGAATGNVAFISSGIPVAAEGLLLSTIEFCLKGDTSSMPLPSVIMYRIGQGIYKNHFCSP